MWLDKIAKNFKQKRPHIRKRDIGRIYEYNKELLRTIALRYKTPGFEFEDHFQSAAMGLIVAIYYCDSSKKNGYYFSKEFRTYAKYWIRTSIRRNIVDGSLIRISDYKAKKINNPVAAEGISVRNDFNYHSELYLDKLIAINDNRIDSFHNKKFANELVLNANLTSLQEKIIAFKFKYNMNDNQIAMHINVTRACVGQNLVQIYDKIRESDRLQTKPIKKKVYQKKIKEPKPKEGIIDCECGCGTQITNYNRHGRLRRYVLGHHRRKRDGQLIYCRCGCGRLIKNCDERGRPRQFVNGHGHHIRKG